MKKLTMNIEDKDYDALSKAARATRIPMTILARSLLVKELIMVGALKEEDEECESH